MGFSKYAIEKKQVSLNMGVTWQDATPYETRNGRLLGTYMTLVECENADCDLEKLGIQLVDEKIPSVICTHVNSTSGDSTSYDTYLPSGIAKSVTFVSGMTSGSSIHSWGSSDNIITDEYNNSSITAKTATISTRWNPIRGEYNSYVLDGMEMISGSFRGQPTCYNITEFMPWIDPNGTIKMAYKVRYVKEHCSDEWKIDEEYTPQFLTFGERWVKTYDGINKATWQHQIATDVVSDDSDLGWKVVWENEGEPFDYEYGVTVPQDVQLIEYLRADGLAASARKWTDFYQMKVKIDPTNLGTPSGYLADKMPETMGDPICDWHWYKEKNSYYVEAKCTDSLIELTPNVWRWINIDMTGTEYIGLFCRVCLRNFDPYICESGGILDKTYVGGLKHIDGNMYFPYKIYSNNGFEDEYLNGLEYGFIDREGDKIPLEYVYGKYTNTNGVTQSLKVNASKTLGARSDVVDVVFSNHVTSLPEGVCSGCTSLTSVDIPSSVTVIGEAAFRGCTSLISVDIPSIVTVIGEAAFRECTSLTSVDIPSSVTEIGDMAFKDCSNLETVNMYSIHPPHVGIGVFTRGIITIPPEADLEEWKTAEGWPRYADKIIKRGSGSKVEPYIYRDSSHKGFISDLGVTLKDNIKIEIKLRPTSNGGGMIIGEVNPPSDNDDYRFFWFDGKIFYDYGSDRKYSRLDINTDYVLEVGNYYIKNLTTGRNIFQGNAKSGVATAHTRTLGLFGKENDYAWIYYIKVYEGDTLVKDFIPFKLEDGSGTLYDTLSKTPCSVSNGTLGIYTV